MRRCASVLLACAALLGADARTHGAALGRREALAVAGLRQCGATVHVSGVDDNLSGVLVDPRTGDLVVVINNPPALGRLSPGDDALHYLTHINGATTDPEGLVWLGRSPQSGRHELAAVQEADADDPVPGNRVVVFDADTLQPTGEVYTYSIEYEHNKGTEGVAYDSETGRFFVVQEKHPSRVLTFPRPAEPTATTSAVDLETWSEDQAGTTDFAGAAVAGGSLLILSEESNMVVQFDLATKNVTGRLPVAGTQPEGVAWDAATETLWVVGEPNEVMRYRADCEAPTEREPPPAPPTPDEEYMSVGEANGAVVAALLVAGVIVTALCFFQRVKHTELHCCPKEWGRPQAFWGTRYTELTTTQAAAQV